MSTEPRRSRGARLARVGAAALIGASITLAMSGVAVADTPDATVHGTTGARVVLVGRDQPSNAGPISITYQGKTEIAYCIDLRHQLGSTGYKSTDWDTSGVDNLNNIKWILVHSYPTVSANDIAAKAGATVPEGIDANVLNNLVYAGTQVAIWHFSDGAALDPNRSFGQADQYAVIRSVYNYLVEQAAKAPEASDPVPTLKIDPATGSGTVGSKVGPYTVVSGGGDVTLTVTGGKIVDKNGEPVTTLKNGGQFWVTSDEAGTVTIDAVGSGEVPIGRVFIHPCDKGGKYQKVILAGVVGTPLKASAKATFTTAPSKPSLPVTGSPVATAVVAGLLLLLVGAGLTMLMMRRRRIRFTA